MTGADHRTILAIGYAVFSSDHRALHYVLLILISLGVFITLGITFTKETGDANQAGMDCREERLQLLSIACSQSYSCCRQGWPVGRFGREGRARGCGADRSAPPLAGSCVGNCARRLWFVVWLTPAGRNFRLENPSNSVAR